MVPFRAIEKKLGRKMSISKALPGTGKSRILSQTMLWLSEDTDGHMVETAMSSVAVDAQLKCCVLGEERKF